jgi:periplasmic protein TonB
MTQIPLHKRPIAIAGAVVLLHVGGLAALQSGLLVRAYEVIVPVEMLSQIIEPPKPVQLEAPPPPPPTPVPKPPEPAKANKAVTLPPAPQPLAIADPTPAPNAPVVAPAAPAPLPPIAAPVAAAPSPSPVAVPTPAPQAPKIELPRSDADYLNNPPPPYPPVSRHMGEQGRVMVRVCVDEKGQPQKTELGKTSGYDRLDATAVATVMRWRFKPGTRNGVPEPGCVGVPVDFKID